MNKLTSKIITLILSIIMVLSMSVPTFAAEKIKVMSYADFLKGQEEGYIGYDVNYEDMVKLAEDSERFLEALEKSEDFYLKYDLQAAKGDKSIPKLAKGDVVITNGTKVPDIPGHAGIAVNADEIFSIDGKKCHPGSKSREEFYNEYMKHLDSWIKVYSPTKAKWGKEAAQWALDTYEDSGVPYSITTDVDDTSKTYCSKIVFQAYKFGAGRKAFESYYDPQTGEVNFYDYTRLIISPYDLPKALKIEETAKVKK